MSYVPGAPDAVSAGSGADSSGSEGGRLAPEVGLGLGGTLTTHDDKSDEAGEQ